jgi:hypothetical protein
MRSSSADDVLCFGRAEPNEERERQYKEQRDGLYDSMGSERIYLVTSMYLGRNYCKISCWRLYFLVALFTYMAEWTNQNDGINHTMYVTNKMLDSIGISDTETLNTNQTCDADTLIIAASGRFH